MEWIQENEYVDYNFRFWEPAYFNNLLYKIYAKLDYLKEHLDRIETGAVSVPKASSLNGSLCVEKKNGEGLVDSLAFQHPAEIKYSDFGITFLNGQFAIKAGEYMTQFGYFGLPVLELKEAVLTTHTGSGEQELDLEVAKWLRIYIEGADAMYLDTNFSMFIPEKTLIKIPVIASSPKLRLLATGGWKVFVNVLDFGNFRVVKGRLPYFYRATVSGDVNINKNFAITGLKSEVPVSYKWDDKELLLSLKELPAIPVTSGTLRIHSATPTEVILLGNEVI